MLLYSMIERVNPQFSIWGVACYVSLSLHSKRFRASSPRKLGRDWKHLLRRLCFTLFTHPFYRSPMSNLTFPSMPFSM